ncbi:mycofactocin biosynthesis glycosyltransferase MftF [Pseudonocardia sp.]|uniref:mycofactocin biosynthesis glycosyltransferase MftF n=1 Tax=Pseudonocardia sp. TaxID=60912 RepID=UPI002639C6AE|nr:mycofactocin biosynthesis glycosyltransferase MftF [Pseudonocardia sp.]MCW2717391.1 glycosyl transferase family 2 [Pseudonocardia sp.]
MSEGPRDTALPLGMRVALERRARVLDGGAVLLGGAPPRMLRLSRAASALIADGGAFTVADRTSAALARTLLDAGIAHPVDVPVDAVPTVADGPGSDLTPDRVAHPVGNAPTSADVTVVVPVKDRAAGLQRLLAALPDGLGGLLVVDDGSADPAGIRAVAERASGRVLRHPASRGPAAARNTGLAAAITPLVAFLDSDVVPEPGWLAPLLARLADPAVGLVAPRIIALDPGTSWLQAYEAVRSSLDLGPDPALIVPRSRVAYVPSAALLVRRVAVGEGFDEAMHVAEDVDLVLRLHAAGWRLRYEPVSRVAHDHRTTAKAWWLRKAYYGTGAAPLAMRHEGAVPPMVLSPWSAAVGVLVLLGRPLSAVAVSAAAAERLSRRLGRVEHPRATATRLIGLGAVGAVAQTADAVTRHYWPVAALACLVSRRARRTVAAVALAEGVVDFARHRGRDPRVRPRLPGYVLARRLDDLAYGAGLWWGAWRHRTLAPLLPGRTGASAPSPRPVATSPDALVQSVRISPNG